MKKRRTAEQWQVLVDGQREAEQSDAEYALAQGVGISSLRVWRGKLRKKEPADGGSGMIEVTPVVPASVLRVILPNGIRLEVTSGLAADYLGRVVGLLRPL